MDRVPLGKTGLQVSPLGMGVIPITRSSWQESLGIIRGVVDLGINWFDTARAYGDTEARLGEALQGMRDDVLLITKSWESDPALLRASVDESLRNLRTDHIDVFLFHFGSVLQDERFLAPGGILETMQGLIKAGKIRFLGFSAHRIERVTLGLDIPALSVVMIPANFISREFLDERLLGKARERGVAVLAMKPLGGGRMENASLCLRFLKTYSGVLPCIGIEKVSEMAEDIETWEHGAPLSECDWAEMERIRGYLGDRFCRQCGYCMPCPQGISISMVAFTKVYVRQAPRDSFIGWYRDAIEGARKCVECRKCVEKCPFQLNIPEMLKDNVAFYDQFVRSA
jgi:uncharacterized protein